ncbi:MAG TPA: phenylalanine--tRNA ligase subunit alpha [Deltaproteobacteria bacterium]|nr:MAG: Phenylalanine--tRNA ligase alpha subunit [Deltaproteobacteria bacterium ADurb.Bin072]HOG84703.1 phenylalanine--tRNA ligase subunit alpha [Deltaproteobacteria bacterium]HRW79155.1 phenylalanine--tRNA ligase subunit alpha [Desulfomonilia bacterium]
MEKQLEELQRQFSQDLEKIHKPEEVEPLRIQYLGRKGRLTAVLRQMGSLGAEERPRMGALSNKLKAFMEQALEEKSTALASEQAATGIDVTLPGRVLRRGSIHVINQVMEEIEDIFRHLGFQIASGPEVEDDYHNFEALNMPENHPARDMQDTFYFSKGTLLRTHTSPVQIRVMEAQGLPVRIIAPGKVYRCDFDITHSPMFHQVEGLWVEEGITLAHLKGVLYEFAHKCFGPDIPLRFRSSFFPFTEPSAEVDMGCIICKGSGCRVCGNTGWLEILGSGMVDPEVYRFVGIDPEKVTGFAFGMGVERIAMIKYGIDDIRLFYDSDLRFLSQFA